MLIEFESKEIVMQAIAAKPNRNGESLFVSTKYTLVVNLRLCLREEWDAEEAQHQKDLPRKQRKQIIVPAPAPAPMEEENDRKRSFATREFVSGLFIKYSLPPFGNNFPD